MEKTLPKPNFKDKTVVCIASGPSLTESDCNLVRLSNHPTIVTNTTFRIAPFADIVFGYDLAWWKNHIDEVNKMVKGRKISYSHAVRSLGVESTYNATWFQNFQHSGACAIGLAISGGANKVILLGYDNKITDKSHWHGEHEGLNNCKSIKHWGLHLANVKKFAEKHHCEIVNCTRDTALTMFKQANLEDTL